MSDIMDRQTQETQLKTLAADIIQQALDKGASAA